jgi:hypothetical protein
VLKRGICEISRWLREEVFSCGSLSRSKLKEMESDKWSRAKKKKEFDDPVDVKV